MGHIVPYSSAIRPTSRLAGHVSAARSCSTSSPKQYVRPPIFLSRNGTKSNSSVRNYDNAWMIQIWIPRKQIYGRAIRSNSIQFSLAAFISILSVWVQCHSMVLSRLSMALIRLWRRRKNSRCKLCGAHEVLRFRTLIQRRPTIPLITCSSWMTSTSGDQFDARVCAEDCLNYDAMVATQKYLNSTHHSGTLLPHHRNLPAFSP